MKVMWTNRKRLNAEFFQLLGEMALHLNIRVASGEKITVDCELTHTIAEVRVLCDIFV
jgi:hypothetical protein